MALYKFRDFYPNYRETFGDSEVIHFDSYSVYSDNNEKIGSVKNILVDQSGRFRYLVVDTGFWIFGKNVLLPIGLANFDYDSQRLYVNGLTKEQVENMPEYTDNALSDESYEQRVRESYRPLASRRNNYQFLGQPARALSEERGRTATATRDTTATRDVDANRYDYDREPAYYGMSEQDNHGHLRLYEEKLVTSKNRQNVGNVKVGKHVETETAEASVPIEKERVVVDRHQPTEARAVKPGDAAFRDSEVARMDVYEESAQIDKQAFVREEVDVHKEVERDNVTAREKLRREELDIDTEGNPRINNDRTNDRNRR